MKQEAAVDVKQQQVRRVMKQDFNMKYARIENLSMKQNSDNNRMLRQQWALAYLGLLKNKKVVLNIDESWLDQTDYRRRKWCVRRTSNSIARKQVQPRISMIMAFDTLGNLYASLTQVNTDSKIMAIYLIELVKVLDRERKEWRKDTVMLLDGAAYHMSGDTLATMKSLRIPVMFLGPHSYNCAACELLFAALKSTHLNVDGVPTGRK